MIEQNSFIYLYIDGDWRTGGSLPKIGGNLNKV